MPKISLDLAKNHPKIPKILTPIGVSYEDWRLLGETDTMPDQNRVRCPVCDHLVWTSNLRKKPRFGVFEQEGVPGGHGITLDELEDKDGIDELAGVKLLDALVMFLREGWLTKEEVLRAIKLSEKEREKWGLSTEEAETEEEREEKIKWGLSPKQTKELLKWGIRDRKKEGEEEEEERLKWGIKKEEEEDTKWG